MQSYPIISIPSPSPPPAYKHIMPCWLTLRPCFSRSFSLCLLSCLRFSTFCCHCDPIYIWNADFVLGYIYETSKLLKHPVYQCKFVSVKYFLTSIFSDCINKSVDSTTPSLQCLAPFSSSHLPVSRFRKLKNIFSALAVGGSRTFAARGSWPFRAKLLICTVHQDAPPSMVFSPFFLSRFVACNVYFMLPTVYLVLRAVAQMVDNRLSTV